MRRFDPGQAHTDRGVTRWSAGGVVRTDRDPAQRVGQRRAADGTPGRVVGQRLDEQRHTQPGPYGCRAGTAAPCATRRTAARRGRGAGADGRARGRPPRPAPAGVSRASAAEVTTMRARAPGRQYAIAVVESSTRPPTTAGSGSPTRSSSARWRRRSRSVRTATARGDDQQVGGDRGRRESASSTVDRVRARPAATRRRSRRGRWPARSPATARARPPAGAASDALAGQQARHRPDQRGDGDRQALPRSPRSPRPQCPAQGVSLGRGRRPDEAGQRRRRSSVPYRAPRASARRRGPPGTRSAR